MTRGELTNELAAQLGTRHEARFIIEDVLGARPADALTHEEVALARALVQRRLDGEPLQYVLGHWAFRALDLVVDPRVLIPRPETEQVVEVALKVAGATSTNPPIALTIVDLGTGSGAIALALATELAQLGRPGAVYAVDASDDALSVTQINLDRVRSASASMLAVTVLHGNWFDPLPAALRGTIDLVVSNPPYVAATEWSQLQVEVRQEPRGALIADAASDGTPGLADVESILVQSLDWLARPGAVVIELAPHQAAAARQLAQALGFVDVAVAPDLAGRSRALVGWLR